MFTRYEYFMIALTVVIAMLVTYLVVIWILYDYSLLKEAVVRFNYLLHFIVRT